jgi:hypothetical protein
MNCETQDITGGIKFFERNQALAKDGNTASATTNDGAAIYLLTNNKYVRWESVNSNDITTEVVTITFKNTRTIDRLLLTRHNLKQYQITYNGTNEFANVSNLDGDLVGGIAETTYDKNTSYYKFDEVQVDSITITMNTTQVADAQKFITELVATRELGTLAGFPRVRNMLHSRNLRGAKVLSGKNVLQPTYETTSFRLGLSNYAVKNDVLLFDSIHEREQSLLVWLCGGRYGDEFFPTPQRGFNLEDLYSMKINRPLPANYANGIYTNGANGTLSFVEVVP